MAREGAMSLELLGLKAPLELAQFKPALAINPVTQAKYTANRLRVVRQVGHSPNPPKDELDLVLFQVNGLFGGELSDDDQLVYVNGVLKGKLLENATLVQQAASNSNSKEQFADSPDLGKALMDAIIDAFEAHQTMSSQALGSERVPDGLKDILLGPAQLYEALPARSRPEMRGP
jgi:hypothetical protein